jgi:protein-tyrosine-phosphatase
VFYLALGYFLSYLPYALLAKALSSGIVPGIDRPVGGLVVLPAAALGQLLAMPMAGVGPPGTGQLIAVVLIVGAVAALPYPALRDSVGRAASPERMVLFVYGENQSRAAMARWLARAELARARSGPRVTIASAGVEVDLPGEPMTDAAYAILQEAGILPHRHRSRRLAPETCRGAAAIYCMTAEHRAAVRALAPDVADRMHLLAEADIPGPATTSPDDHRRSAGVIQDALRMRPMEQFL